MKYLALNNKKKSNLEFSFQTINCLFVKYSIEEVSSEAQDLGVEGSEAAWAVLNLLISVRGIYSNIIRRIFTLTMKFYSFCGKITSSKKESKSVSFCHSKIKKYKSSCLVAAETKLSHIPGLNCLRHQKRN